MDKFNFSEQFAAANKANLETFASLANSAFARAERLTALNVNTARSVLEDGIAVTQTILGAKSPQDLNGLQTALAQPMMDKTVAYGRGVYEIAAEAQQEVTQAFEAQFAELNKNFTNALDQAAKSAPAGSDVVFSAIKSAVAAGNNAYENASRATRQLVEVTEGNVAKATQATIKAASDKKAA